MTQKSRESKNFSGNNAVYYNACYNTADHNQFEGKKWLLGGDGQLKRERLPSAAAGAACLCIM